MSNLIKQAEALEVRASNNEHVAGILTGTAEKYRAEAAKLREQAVREPLRLWVNWYRADRHHSYDTEAEARACAGSEAARIAVPMVEVRPGYALVKVPTDEEILLAMRQVPGCSYGSDFCRLFIEALGLRDSLAGVEVEK